MEMSASVIVPTRGGVLRLPRLVRALAQQDTDNFEVTFVVDGDIDGSVNFLESPQTKRLLPASRVIEFLENRGRSSALNEGHNASVGDVLIRCDDDLEPAPNYISAHIARHATVRQGVIGLYRNSFPETPYARAYGRDSDRKFSEDALASPHATKWRYWAGNVSIHREMWTEIGEYDLSYRKYGWEDVDYGYRIYSAGYPVVIAPELTTTHHVAAVTTKIRSLRALHAGAARERFLEIHGEDSLPDNGGRGIWNILVGAVARGSTEKSLAIAANSVDRSLPFLPKIIGKKMIALLVEGAGESGIRYPERAKSSF